MLSHLIQSYDDSSLWCRIIYGHTSSRQREFHPKPLTEPYVIVSHHTALHIHETISGLKLVLSSSSEELTK